MPRPKRARAAILAVMRSRPDEDHYGWKLIGETGMLAGAVYPALTRLRADGLVEEQAAPGNGPARRMYRLSAAGRNAEED